MTYPDVLEFWFKDLTPDQWFRADRDLDKLITSKFKQLHEEVASGLMNHWRLTAEGRLAEIIILDQFSRNIYRGTPRAFIFDNLALCLAREAVDHGDDRKLTPNKRMFMYMPFMHSESAEVHKIAVELFRSLGLQQSLDYELRHKEIIDHFGRFPHRNAILGRKSSKEEIEFLKTPNSRF